MGKRFWVQGWWTNCLTEALAIARRIGAPYVHRTDGWQPVAVIAWA